MWSDRMVVLNPKLVEISAAEASRIIVRGLARGRPTIAFPRLLALGCVLNMLLPAWASDLTDAPFRADVEPDDGITSWKAERDADPLDRLPPVERR